MAFTLIFANIKKKLEREKEKNRKREKDGDEMKCKHSDLSI